MLTHRTNVLFSAEEHAALTRISKANKKTMGELIRHAVKQTYKISGKDSFLASLERVRELTGGVKVSKSEMRDWIKMGRKYEE